MIGNVPNIPTSYNKRDVDVNMPLPPFLAYVYGQVMFNERGLVGFHREDDCLILYLKVDQNDQLRPMLGDVSEVWIALKRRE